ncbi:methyltransferase domain-containing protein [Amycolatopsis sp. cg5]|uniref:methyltransferase domain-containing protein n=1 Tax=Amycolatopsis sp. cg5 TaxID=3238802 RepID=UPI0035235251
MTSVDDWRGRAEELRAELVSAGKLASFEWQAAVTAVPRHKFVPEFFQRGAGGWELVSARDPGTRDRWLKAVYANTSLVTRIGEVPDGGRDRTGPTSSASAPGLMTRMLEALDLRAGDRVLEIGTGTGYNAALLSHRLGDDNVYSVDIDPDLVDGAAANLRALGYRPTLAVADGADGFPGHGPYERIIATCAVPRVPWSWAEQTVVGGLVLVDVKVHAVVGNLVLLRRYADRLEGRFDPGNATFMQIRSQAFHLELPGPPVRDRQTARQRTTSVSAERLWENAPLWFLLHLIEPGRVEFGFAADPQGGIGPEFYTGRDGSWCEVTSADGGAREVWEGGPRSLWSSIEAAVKSWTELGMPGWDRFGLTVRSAEEQVVWLDQPTSPHRWTLVRSR